MTADFRAGIRYLLSVRVLVIMTVMQIIVNLCLATEKLMFFYARDALGLSAAGVGAVVAAGGLGGVAGALSASWLAERAGQIRLVVLTVAASGLAVGSVSVTHSLVTLCAANLAYLWAITVASLANRTYRQLIVPRELLGRVTSTVRLLFLTADPLGVVIAGSLAAAIGDPGRCSSAPGSSSRLPRRQAGVPGCGERGQRGRPLTLVPLVKPPNSSDSTMRMTTRAVSPWAARQPGHAPPLTAAVPPHHVASRRDRASPRRARSPQVYQERGNHSRLRG